jgi:hypothetical protein
VALHLHRHQLWYYYIKKKDMKEPLFVYISYRKKKRALKMDLASSCRTGWSHPKKGNILCTFIILFWPANLYKGTHSVFFILIEIFVAPKKKRRSRTSAWMVSSLVFVLSWWALAADRCCCARLGTSHQDTSIIIWLAVFFYVFLRRSLVLEKVPR